MKIEIAETIQSFANTWNHSKAFNTLNRAFQKGVLNRKRREYNALLNKMDRNPKTRFNRSRNRKFKK